MNLFLGLKDGQNKSEILKKNIEIAKGLRNKISLLNYNFKTDEEEVKEELVIKEEISEEVEQDDSYRYYYDNIIEALESCKTEAEVENAIYENLPVIDNGDYINIVRRIILEFVKEKKVLEQLKVGEGEEEIKSLSTEQDRLDFIIGIIRNHRYYEKNEPETKSKHRNKLVFLKTSSGNIYAESDLSSIDFKYYPGFKELLESIEDGTFKNVKRLNSNDHAFKSLSEVKDFKIRVVFDRLNADTYIILDIFVKKTNWDNGYLEQLQNRLSYYQCFKKSIKDGISLEYLTENEKIRNNIMDGLDKKVITKTKKGD